MQLLCLLLLQRCPTHSTPLCPPVTTKHLTLTLTLRLLLPLTLTLTLTTVAAEHFPWQITLGPGVNLSNVPPSIVKRLKDLAIQVPPHYT